MHLGNTETRVGIFVLSAFSVFMYMGFQVDAFRFNNGNYVSYHIHFTDIAGLARKGDVKIAGVKVGWVEDITLLNTMSAHVTIMVLKQFHLYQSAYALVRQNGLLGPHFIEIMPGDALLPPLSPGDTLGKQNREQVSVDDLMYQFKKIASNVEQVTESLKEVLPAFQNNIEKIANAFDRDLHTMARRFETTSCAIEQCSAHVASSIHDAHTIVEKIDAGKGFLGKLVNEDEAYQDFKSTIHGFKKYLTQFERFQCVFDTHIEAMLRTAENYEYQDSKGYFDMRIHPNEHSFYVFQIVTSEKGFAYRKNIERDYINLEGLPVSFQDNHVVPETISDVSSNDLFIEPPNLLIEREQQFERNTIKLGIQFGKVYKDIAFRLGLFEGTAGFGLDVDIPFGTDQFRWISTFELFDVRGFNRRNDKRPHLKWLNRIFVFDNIYMIFGADDFVSKRNASAFLGAGVRFGDDDVKYVLDTMTSIGQTSIQTYAGE